MITNDRGNLVRADECTASSHRNYLRRNILDESVSSKKKKKKKKKKN